MTRACRGLFAPCRLPDVLLLWLLHKGVYLFFRRSAVNTHLCAATKACVSTAHGRRERFLLLLRLRPRPPAPTPLAPVAGCDRQWPSEDGRREQKKEMAPPQQAAPPAPPKPSITHNQPPSRASSFIVIAVEESGVESGVLRLRRGTPVDFATPVELARDQAGQAGQGCELALARGCLSEALCV